MMIKTGRKTETYALGDGRERIADWVCSRFFLLTALFCLFANPAAESCSLFAVLLSAGVQAVVLITVKKWINRGGKRRETAVLTVGFAVMLCAQFLMFTQAGGYPEDRNLWMEAWSGLPVLGEWIGNNCKISGAAGFLCVDFSILLALGSVRRRKDEGEKGAGFCVCFFLFLLSGISPWLLIPQPLFFVMPAITGLMLLGRGRLKEEETCRRKEPKRERDGERDQDQEQTEHPIEIRVEEYIGSRRKSRKTGYMVCGLAVVLFFLCLCLSGLHTARAGEVCGGKSAPQLLLYWFDSLKNGLSDGSFGWKSAPVLIPFTQNGWALRLQNTVYPGADRYGWYAALTQGAWALMLVLQAALPVRQAGKETVFFLAALLFLPLLGQTGCCMATAVFLPWLSVRVSGVRRLTIGRQSGQNITGTDG